MEGLYRKVTRGYYTRISKNYSEDLSKILKYLIKVKPQDRMNCSKNSLIIDEIMETSIMKRKMKNIGETEVEEESILLKTIKLEKNINYLTENLPKPNYLPLRYKALLI